MPNSEDINEPTPRERIEAAEQAVKDTQAASARAAGEYAQAIADAQRYLTELHRELGDAA